MMPAGSNERPMRRWTWATTALLALAVAAGFVIGQTTRPLGAQAVKAAPPVAYTYRQSNVYWQYIAKNLNEWAEKGWEVVQIVPLINSNPGAGGEMQAVIVYRSQAAEKGRR
jgi:hypothetical protein